MTFQTFLKIALFILWIYLLSVFKRGKLEFFKFTLGSVGFFLIAMNFIDYMKKPIIYLFTAALGMVGNATGLFSGYSKYGMFFIDHGTTVMSLYIDLECSGLIEMLVFVSLIAFFPVYNGFKKIIMSVIGICSIFVFNLIRVFTIIMVIYMYGSPAYSISHSIIGRLIFYFLVVRLYFYVFTKGQLNSQKVGNFSYNGADNSNYIEKEEEEEIESAPDCVKETGDELNEDS